ncbi:hypothetical protein R3W88_011927 [Solanum pinnatisectum]|uniref:Uncharacterized protein n=1 Tax=Solanum pinnatisectum TaxID=50273 RepID=A0AAV9L8L9_9SOLN|nr:hypothetical protein R3W88_011927 [Solanum pinnatisectum]
MLSILPAFILSQDQTLHEIYSCITYSFLQIQLEKLTLGLGIIRLELMTSITSR